LRWCDIHAGLINGGGRQQPGNREEIQKTEERISRSCPLWFCLFSWLPLDKLEVMG
jgi:hypothetical protein